MIREEERKNDSEPNPALEKPKNNDDSREKIVRTREGKRTTKTSEGKASRAHGGKKK